MQKNDRLSLAAVRQSHLERPIAQSIERDRRLSFPNASCVSDMRWQPIVNYRLQTPTLR